MGEWLMGLTREERSVQPMTCTLPRIVIGGGPFDEQSGTVRFAPMTAGSRYRTLLCQQLDGLWAEDWTNDHAGADLVTWLIRGVEILAKVKPMATLAPGAILSPTMGVLAVDVDGLPADCAETAVAAFFEQMKRSATFWAKTGWTGVDLTLRVVAVGDTVTCADA